MKTRLACLHLPRLPLEALFRAQPGLRTRPVVVAAGEGPAAQALAVSDPAAAAGLGPGLSLAGCRRLLAEVEVLGADPELERAACEELATAAAAYSPWVEVSAPGTVMLDATGVGGLFGGELGFGTSLLATLATRGLGGRLGVASSRAVAFAAACLAAPHPQPGSFQVRGAVTVVPAGCEAAFLAPLPLTVFGPAPEALALLADMGIRTCGSLQGLARASLVARLGEAGLALAARARGEDPSALLLPVGGAPPAADPWACHRSGGLPPPGERPRARLELEAPLQDRIALLAALDELLDRLLPALAGRGLGVDGLRVSFELDPAGVELRLIPTAAPGLSSRSLRNLLAERLARDPPSGPVAALELELQPARVQPVQLSLFLPAGPSPFELAQTLARLEGIVGVGRLCAPQVREDHRPAAYDQERFAPHPHAVRTGASAPAGTPATCYSQLRSLRPPRRIRVRIQGARPASLEDGSPWIDGRAAVVRAAGPWPVSGGWWSHRPFDRHYWDVETADGRLLRLFQDRTRGGWWLDGIHD